uniref:Uncharacterized protein n=1 Tax=Setaria italica TaxID=4555 RepID=K3YNI3_SETIT
MANGGSMVSRSITKGMWLGLKHYAASRNVGPPNQGEPHSSNRRQPK